MNEWRKMTKNDGKQWRKWRKKYENDEKKFKMMVNDEKTKQNDQKWF